MIDDPVLKTNLRVFEDILQEARDDERQRCCDFIVSYFNSYQDERDYDAALSLARDLARQVWPDGG